MLSNLLTEEQLLDESFSFSPLGFPSNGDSPASLLSESKGNITCQNDPLSVLLNVPSAFGIKTTHDKVTYINKGIIYKGREREREREIDQYDIISRTCVVCMENEDCRMENGFESKMSTWLLQVTRTRSSYK